MSSQDPPEDKGKRSVRQTMKRSFQWTKDAFRRPSSPRPPSGPTGQLTTVNSGSRFQLSLGSSTPALITGPPPPVSDQHAITPSPGPPTRASGVDAKEVIGTEHKDSENGAWNGLKNTLCGLESNVGLFPPLKSAVGALIGCLDVLKAAASNREDYDELAEEFKSAADVLKQYAGELESEPRKGSIANIAECIQRQVTDIKQQQDRGTVGRLLHATHDEEDVIKRYRQIERLFRQLQCDLSMRTRSDVKKQLETTLLRGMSPVDDARYNSSYSTTIKRNGCTAETREAIQQTLQEWSTDPDGKRIYWMNGMAGTGKTTIAYSFCEWLECTNRLGASFFCSRISSTCRSLSRIVPTIAYQLARYSPAFRSTLCAALRDNPDAGTLNVAQQFESLVYQPMKKAKDAIPDSVVIIIDALDECDDAHSIRLLLSVLLKVAEDIPVKFFVASRPEHAIRDRMMSRGGASRSIVYLHDIEQSIVEEDIKKYLTEALSSMSPPPLREQIAMLAKRSRNLFIYAATVVRYIYPEDIHVNSGARLKSMLATINDPKVVAENKYEDLDRLYTTVLTAVFNARLDRAEKECMQRVLWTIVCAKEPMTVATIASLASLEEIQVWSSLQSLRSVVHVPENNTLISTLHASFPEYMLDQSRSGELCCNETEANEKLVHQFFDIMQSELRFNICDLKSSYHTDDQVEDLDTRISQCISPTLSYACRYWSDHLLLAPASKNASDKVINFLSNHFLFWMEVLSLSRCIGIGAPMMQQVQTWLQLIDTPNEIQKRLSDARNFVTWFAANPCSRSTPHIYISALPLCAKSNWVYQHYSQQIQGLVSIAIGQRDEAVLAIWNVETGLYTGAISPGGSHIAVGCDNGSIQLYDIHTGATAVEPFKGHTDMVCSIAFSPDGTLIASGSDDNTVIIWDTHTGRIVTGPLHDHNSAVYSVAFSPDGSRVVSGSADKSVIIWNTYSGDKAIGPLEGHSDEVNSVVFSPDGRLITSASNDRSIRLWDPNTGANVNEPLIGHEDQVWMVAFSPDGSQLASCSSDKTIRLWDVQTGTLVGQLLNVHQAGAFSLSFSSNGTHIVSGGRDEDFTIIVWDTHTKSAIVGPLRGHTRLINSVTFLPDNTRVVSFSYDNTIRIWDVQTNRINTSKSVARELSVGPVAFTSDHTQFISASSTGTLQLWDMYTGAPISRSFEGQAELGTIHSVAFSSQGTQVAAGANDSAIWVWNFLTGEMAIQPLTGHTDAVTCLTFSPNGAFLCSGSKDCTIAVWNVGTGGIVGRRYQGHSGSVRSVVYSHDGTHIASGAADHTVRIWDPISGSLVHTLSGHKNSVESVAFSTDGRYIFSGSTDETIRRWDIHGECSVGDPTTLFETHDASGTSDPVEYRCSDPVKSLAFFPDGDRIIAGFGSSIYVFDTQLAQILSETPLPGQEKVHWVGLSPDGINIISISTSKSNETEDSKSEQVVSTLAQQPTQSPNIIRVWRADQFDQAGSTSGDWLYNRDGRVLSPDGFVIWVPRDLMPYLENNSVSHRNPYILSSDGIIDLGYKNLCIGDRWKECYSQKR